MDDKYTSYVSPLSGRYRSREMQEVFSRQKKFSTWRKLWIILAESEKELGLPIPDLALEEMRATRDEINFREAEARERVVRHDVMSHIYAWGLQCPHARGIIHLGATSRYVQDNTDIIIIRDALKILRKKIITVLKNLGDFALKYADMPTLAYTHFQAAQPTTVGKRAALWAQDLVYDLEDLDYVAGSLRPLGSKGTTGTRASFLDLFDGDREKCRELDALCAEKMGFPARQAISGQTYCRKTDFRVLSVLSGIAQSAHKFSNDLRLLRHLKEIEEPFEKGQVGSSAMAYKRNPMRRERMASLSNYVINNLGNRSMTYSTQWFERTLDDSANRRLSISDGFLAADGILNLYINISGGLVVYPRVIKAHLDRELPFMATENILMDAVKAGGDRQALHERIRVHSMEAARAVKEEGKENDLVCRIAADPVFSLTEEEINSRLRGENYTGLAPKQTRDFCKSVLQPIFDQNPEDTDRHVKITL